MTTANSAESSITLPDAPADQREILLQGGVACWSEPVLIDTYSPAEPDEFPMFLDRRVYQGSSGRIYPVPFTDSISQEKKPHLWQAIHLENQWVRLMLLPELGGRIHIGYDKTNNYDFFYRNNVIKPALVGLAGPWISGGVEFNWPQHHRPGTYLPVETSIERDENGTATVWHSDLDPLQRMRGTHGVRLSPDSSLIEVAVRLYNRTDEPQTFLWWANVAAHAHSDYQSFFPTDVHYVADHARRAITAFPRADRPYYGVDYPALVNESNPEADRIDFYSNIPVPTSYMITDTEDHFFGGYDHRASAGFIHWADRSIAPGKKQWTWGSGAVGQAWDRQLTDTDGPYVELMAGVFTDNQPDFSYLAPGETRTFSQFWYPIQHIGPAHQAGRDLAVSLEGPSELDGEGTARFGVASATVRRGVRIVLSSGDDVISEHAADLSPASPFVETVQVPAHAIRGALTLRVVYAGEELISWTRQAAVAIPSAEPWVATEPPAPADIRSTDELFVTGTHLDQYRHPTRSAVPYYEEILRRDPSDSRACLAVGARHYRRGEYAEAEHFYDRALQRLTLRNLNPVNSEVHYRLGLLFERTHRPDSAQKHYEKAAWDAAWAHPSYLGLARLALTGGRSSVALDHAGAAQRLNEDSPAAKHLMVHALRASNREAAAEELLGRTVAQDPLDPVALAMAGQLNAIDPGTRLTVALEFARSGDLTRALMLTEKASLPAPSTLGNHEPMRHYHRAQWFDALQEPDSASVERLAARSADTKYAFPYGLDDYDALTAALRKDPSDHVAYALLGAWLLDAGRQEEAYAALTSAVDLGSTDAVAWRNAAVALVNTGGALSDAVPYFEHALTLKPNDPRLVFERALLAALRNEPLNEQIHNIEQHGESVFRRDDLTLHYVNLLVEAGRENEALAVMQNRVFQPFEGGEGKAIAAYDRAALAVARGLIDAEPSSAVELLRSGLAAPVNLSEGRHPANSLAERYVVLGEALDALGDTAGANEAWVMACAGPGAHAADRVTDTGDFWRGIAHLKLGQNSAAAEVWSCLEERAAEIESNGPQVDYFATSLPELLLFNRDSGSHQLSLAADLRALAQQGRSLQKEEITVP